jgi:hypothetical protein
MADKKAKIYKFRPLRTLTALALFFMVLKILGLGGLLGLDVYEGLTTGILDINDLKNPLVAAFDITSLVYLIVVVISGLITLTWMAGATRNTLAVRPGLAMSQFGAVGWWFVPFASLYKPYQYVRDIWFTARGNIRDVGTSAERPLGIWWFTFLGGNIVGYLVNRFAPTNWIGVGIGFALSLTATVLFFNIVRTIGRDQKGQDMAAADVF